jgi:D-tyrosyl-tRNA(Tyr) deacylase
MKCVAQRVKSAAVECGGKEVSRIGKGMLVLLGVGTKDGEDEAFELADKLAKLRIFDDQTGRMNLAAGEADGEVLVVSQFTLYADCDKGRRPSFTAAAPPEQARELIRFFCQCLSAAGLKVKEGAFGEKMAVGLVNDGPVTLILEK